MKKIIFYLYRYQILPKDRHLQLNIFYNNIKTLEELINKKNEIFAEALCSINMLKTKKSVIKYKLLYHHQDVYLFKFAVNRPLVIETEDFTEEEVSNWPSVFVFVWNSPNKQIFAIQDKRKAFQNTDFLANAIVSAINNLLSRWNLAVYCKPIFIEKAFWDLIKVYKGKIKDIIFELITPNLANISGALSEEIKQLARDTNAVETKYELISAPDSSINLDEKDPRIKGLVHYSSKGGGDISIKISGLKKRIRTKNSKKYIEINEVEASGDFTTLVKLLKELIDE